MSTDTVTKRLHVGGITPNITISHIRDRFASFGKVQMVEELANDALGQRRLFTFLTIDTTPSQLKKCLNIMSGSMWRGTQLRISEAKPVYTQRLADERASLKVDMERKTKKRKRGERAFNMATGIGKEAQDMRPVTTSNYTSKKFWNLTPTGHLVRPLAMRPCHSIPPSLQDKPSSATKSRPAPTRARRRVIDPYLWAPTHLGEASILSQIPPTTGEEGVWVWEDAEEHAEEHAMDEGEDEEEIEGTILVGRWHRMVNDEVAETQSVRQKRRSGETLQDEEEESAVDEDELEDEQSGDELFAKRLSKDDSPLFGTRREERESSDVEVDTSLARSPSPLFGTRQAVDEEPSPAASSRSASPLFGSRTAVDTEIVQSETISSSISDKHSENSETGSTASHDEADNIDAVAEGSPFITTIPTPPVTMIPSEPKSAPTRTQIALPDPLRRQFQSERSRDLSLLDSILSTSDSDLLPRKPIFGGFAESDDEDGEGDIPRAKEEGVLRLRGGAPDEDDDQDMSSDNSDADSEPNSSSESDSGSESASASSSGSSSSSGTSSSSSDSDEDDDDEEDEEDEENEEADSSTTKTARPSSRPLKAMFAPTAQSSGGGGFSLMASLDPDLELDELDVPLAPSVRPAGQDELAPLEPLHPTSTVTGLFDPDPSIPLFFPTASTFTDNTDAGKKGKDGYAETMQNEEWRGFWRVEGETDEMMKDIWNRDRGELTKGWKKRHREAKKHRRRRGGVEEEQP